MGTHFENTVPASNHYGIFQLTFIKFVFFSPNVNKHGIQLQGNHITLIFDITHDFVLRIFKVGKLLK